MAPISTPSLSNLEFPMSISGIANSLLAFLAEALSDGSEVPREFYFASSLTALGSIAAGRLRISANVDCEPRLYTVLLGTSYDVKKSTAMKRTVRLFAPLLEGRIECFQSVGKIIHGVGSAEGLAREIEESKHVLLCYDEMKAMMDKSVIKGSVLLPMITSMFEGVHYSSAVKNKKQSIDVKDGHLAILGCCTTNLRPNVGCARYIHRVAQSPISSECRSAEKSSVAKGTGYRTC